MSRTIFRGTTLGGTSVREIHLYEVNDQIAIALSGPNGETIIDLAVLDLTMAMGLAVSLRDRVRDIEDRRNWEDEA